MLSQIVREQRSCCREIKCAAVRRPRARERERIENASVSTMQQARRRQRPLWASVATVVVFALSLTSIRPSMAFASRVLVTGGAGYIGSHTCVELIKAGEKVTQREMFRTAVVPVTLIVGWLARGMVYLYCDCVATLVLHNRQDRKRVVVRLTLLSPVWHRQRHSRGATAVESRVPFGLVGQRLRSNLLRLSLCDTGVMRAPHRPTVLLATRTHEIARAWRTCSLVPHLSS